MFNRLFPKNFANSLASEFPKISGVKFCQCSESNSLNFSMLKVSIKRRDVNFRTLTIIEALKEATIFLNIFSPVSDVICLARTFCIDRPTTKEPNVYSHSNGEALFELF